MPDSHIHGRETATFVALLLFVFLWTLIFPPSVFTAPPGDAKGTREYWISRYGEVKTGPLLVRARSVFRAVLAASDRRDGVEPTLHVLDSDTLPWAQSLSDGAILLSKKALGFCYAGRSIESGDARLSFVLGHEMAHQFNGDFWEHRFLQGVEGKKGDDSLAFQDVKKAAEAPGAALARELQADQYGVIYAVLAGYDADTLFTGDRNFLLEWAEKSAPGRAHEKEFRTYLSNREKAIEMRLGEVAEQVGLFKLGVASFSAGRQDEALLLFRRFAVHFPSREVFANIGTVHLAKAYTKFLSSRTANSFPFELAFGIEGHTRAETIDVARGFDEERFADYKASARESIQALERAISHDPTYAPARNSLGCAFLIDGRLYDAVSALETACRLDPGDARYRSNLAVAYLLLGQEIRSDSLTEKGEKFLAELEGKLSIARQNRYALRVFRGETVDSPVPGDAGEWPMPLAPPAKNELAIYRSGTTLRIPGSVRIVEEFSEGKIRYRVYAGPGNTIFILERNGNVRLALQRDREGGLGKGGESPPGGVLVSIKGRNGYIYAGGRAVDYFEF